MSGHFLFIHVNQGGEIRSPDTIPLSLAYQLACLQAEGFSGRILGDYLDRPLSAATFKEVLLKDRPMALGLTVYEANIHRVRIWARYAKELAPTLPIILGGPQITFMPGDALLQLPETDALCRGEGEVVALEIARVLSRGQDLAGVPGLCRRQGEEVAEAPPPPEAPDLDRLPSPVLSGLIDPAGKDRIMLLTSRGCSASCAFCYTPRASGRRIRYHSVERVIAELEYLRAAGARDFWFADPNFAASKRRLAMLLEAIIARVPGITFWCQTRYDHMDRELAGLLKAAGAHSVAFGLESAHPEVMEHIDKRLDLERLTSAIRLVQAAGMEVELFTMFGLPGETFSRACSTLDFVQSHGVTIDGNSICQQLHLFFGTQISEAPEGHGVIPLARTRPAYLSVGREFETTAMSREELRRMGLLWRLNHADFTADVETGRNLFSRAGFITANHADLSGRPEADLLLARILLALEEYDQATPLLARLATDFGELPSVRQFLAAPFTGFKAARRAEAKSGCKVIFDCKGFLDGRTVPATEGWYQEAVLGDRTLLPDFEEGLLGMRSGRPGQFMVTFPADYGNAELAGRTLTFRVFLHQVLEPVQTDSVLETSTLPRNKYRFSDLEGLRQHNERLYYLVLREMIFRDLRQEMTDFLSLLKFKLQLGFEEEARAMAAVLTPGSEAAHYAGRILLSVGKAEEAIALLPSGEPKGEGAIELISARIRTGNYQEAERLAASPLLAEHLQALELRVWLASILRLPLPEYLERVNALLSHQVRSLSGAGIKSPI